MSYSSVVLAHANVQSYWKMDEASGNLADSKGAVAGTANGSLTYNQPKIINGEAGGSILFGTGAYFDMGNVYDFAGTVAFSFGVWMKQNATGAIRRLTGTTPTNRTSGWYAFWTIGVPGNTEFGRANAGGFDSCTFEIPGGIVFLVCTYDGTNNRVYVNGKLVNTNGSAKLIPADAATFRVGRTPDSTNVHLGHMQGYAIYNAALSQADVTAQWDAGRWPSLIGSDRRVTRNTLLRR